MSSGEMYWSTARNDELLNDFDFAVDTKLDIINIFKQGVNWPE